MPDIPFERQIFPEDPVEQLNHQLAQGKVASGAELLFAIECSVDHRLGDRLRQLISRFSVPAVRRRGRPCSSIGAEDFALEDVDDAYPSLLREHEEKARQRRTLAAAEGTVLPSAERTPSELAYTEILSLPGMKQVFPNIGWMALRNKHSAWKAGRFHSAENQIDSVDFDAEIERLFPASPD